MKTPIKAKSTKENTKTKTSEKNQVDVYIIWLDSCIRRITRQKVKGVITERLSGSPGFMFNTKGLQFAFRQPAFVKDFGVSTARSDHNDTFAFQVTKPNESTWNDVMPGLMKCAVQEITKTRKEYNSGFDEQIYALVLGNCRTLNGETQ